MKKILFVMVLLLSSTYGSSLDTGIKSECQYRVYGNWNGSPDDSIFMYGIIRGTVFSVESPTEFAKSAKPSNIMNRACKEALNNNGPGEFTNKFLWGVTVTVNNKLEEYRTIH